MLRGSLLMNTVRGRSMEVYENEKEVRFRLKSIHYEVEESVFSLWEENGDNEEWVGGDILNRKPEETEMQSVGILRKTPESMELRYEETEATGMEGAVTSLFFQKDYPGMVSMSRSGSISTTLVFEEGKRYRCVYKTPYMQFEVCVRSLKVKNTLGEDGCLTLDYIIEIRGAKAERTKLFLQILP